MPICADTFFVGLVVLAMAALGGRWLLGFILTALAVVVDLIGGFPYLVFIFVVIVILFVTITTNHVVFIVIPLGSRLLVGG